MSYDESIAVITESLRRLLMGAYKKIQGFKATVGSPLSEGDSQDAAEHPHLNLFLYRITEERWPKSQEFRAERHPADCDFRIRLVLHYLITLYGSGETTEQSENLESAKANAPQTVRTFARTVALEDFEEVAEEFGTSGLGEPFERIKITLEPISLEELSKCWTGSVTPYRISDAYSDAYILQATLLVRQSNDDDD